LAHPRNPRAAQNTPANLAMVPVGLRMRFAEIRLICQEGQAPWEVRAVHPQTSADTNQ
jgi:hypothetical protein